MLAKSVDPCGTASIVATYGQGMLRMALVAYELSRFEREAESFLTGLAYDLETVAPSITEAKRLPLSLLDPDISEIALVIVL